MLVGIKQTIFDAAFLDGQRIGISGPDKCPLKRRGSVSEVIRKSTPCFFANNLSVNLVDLDSRAHEDQACMSRHARSSFVD